MADATLSSHSLVQAAIYARVSTANNGQDPSMQTREIREYCERRGWQVEGEYKVNILTWGSQVRRRNVPSLID